MSTVTLILVQQDCFRKMLGNQAMWKWFSKKPHPSQSQLWAAQTKHKNVWRQLGRRSERFNDRKVSGSCHDTF